MAQLVTGLAALVPQHAARPFGISGGAAVRAPSPLLLEVPRSRLPYEVPPMPKPFADYEWDPTFPGTFKPGQRGENADLDEVLEEWKDKENPACMELPQDQLWQVPLAPPEDILSWLKRIGLLEEEETGQEEDEILGRGDSLLDDEFDLDDPDEDESGGNQESLEMS